MYMRSRARNTIDELVSPGQLLAVKVRNARMILLVLEAVRIVVSVP